MVDSLERLQDGDNKVIEKLRWQADDSTKLADEISKLLSLAENTYPLIRDDNLVRAMTIFMKLSENHKKMREGFDELLTGTESYIASFIVEKLGIPHEEIEEADKDKKQEWMMSFMKKEKNPDGGPQWSNREIGFFFNMEANTVVNRMTKIRNRKSR